MQVFIPDVNTSIINFLRVMEFLYSRVKNMSLLAALYTLYTFYLGVTVMKKCPHEKAVPYTIVVVICGIVLGAIVGSLVMSTMFGGATMTGGAMRLYQ